MKTKKVIMEVPVFPKILDKDDYKFIEFYCKAHLIPVGRGYRNVLALFLEEYKLNIKKSCSEKEIILQLRRMLICHSGREWGSMTPDTAVTEYRGMLLKKLDEVFK